MYQECPNCGIYQETLLDICTQCGECITSEAQHKHFMDMLVWYAFEGPTAALKTFLEKEAGIKELPEKVFRRYYTGVVFDEPISRNFQDDGRNT